MKKLKRFGALGLALAMALAALSGCAQKDPASNSTSASGSLPDSASGSDSSAQAPPMDLSGVTDPYLAVAGLSGDAPAARVGEEEITLGELLYWFSRSANNYLYQFSGYFDELPWDTDMGDGSTLGELLKDDALNAAAYYRTLRLTAEQEGLSPGAEVSASLDREFSDMAGQLGSADAVTHVLWAQMLTRDLLAYLNETSDLYNQLQELYFGENSGNYPTDAEVQAYLDETGRYRAKHILLSTVDDNRQPLDEATVAQKKADADNLLSQLRAAEDPIALFDQLMKQYSEDPGLAANPEGYTTSKGEMVAPFEEAALALQNGEISDVVESDYGYHIILRLPMDPADYRSQLVGQRMDERLNQLTRDRGVEALEAYEQLDPADVWEKLTSLQSAVQSEIQAVQGG